MSNRFLNPGLHIVRRWSTEKGGYFHFAIVDVGNHIGATNAALAAAILLEFSIDGMRFHTYDSSEGWQFVETIVAEAEAVARLSKFAKTPQAAYHLLANNCEHFVWFVAKGERKSPQVRTAGFALAAVLLVFMVANGN